MLNTSDSLSVAFLYVFICSTLSAWSQPSATADGTADHYLTGFDVCYSKSGLAVCYRQWSGVWPAVCYRSWYSGPLSYWICCLLFQVWIGRLLPPVVRRVARCLLPQMVQRTTILLDLMSAIPSLNWPPACGPLYATADGTADHCPPSALCAVRLGTAAGSGLGSCAKN
jgi:hypothetical protein